MKDNQLKTIEETIKHYEPRLQALGFEKRDSVTTTKKEKDTYEFRFSSKDRSSPLCIDLYFSPSIAHVQCTIEKDERHYIRLWDYFAKHGKTALRELQAEKILSKGQMTADRYYRKYLDICLNCLETDLRDVLEGRRWERVDFDWSLAGE